MTETEFDEIISAGLHDIASNCRLPEDFSKRLVKSVKGSKTAWRIKLTAIILSAMAVGVIVSGIARGKSLPESQEAMLIAADAPVTTENVTGWFLLGYLRECFKRNRNSKRKEEE